MITSSFFYVTTKSIQREPLATTFTCLFCNHEKAVQVKLDKKAAVGDLWCKVCGQKWQTSINYLSAAVDVYADWIDACENVAQEAVAQEAEDKRFSSYATTRGGGAAATTGGGDDEEGEADYDDE
jgi:transcription elongation factor Elf1